MAKIEGFGRWRDGMDDDEARRRFARGAPGAGDGIGKKRASQSVALPRAAYRETAEEDTGDMRRHVAAHRACDILGEDMRHAERDIARDRIRPRRADDIGPACSVLQIAPGALAQPIVQHRLA